MGVGAGTSESTLSSGKSASVKIGIIGEAGNIIDSNFNFSSSVNRSKSSVAVVRPCHSIHWCTSRDIMVRLVSGL